MPMDTVLIEAWFAGESTDHYINGKLYCVQFRETAERIGVGKTDGHWRYYNSFAELLKEWSGVTRVHE